MSNCRIHGKSPYKVAVIHGGPGAAGSLKELAQVLSNDYGILEPLQTATSIKGQIEELRQTLEQNAELPVTLIGHSWGAMLGYLFTAEYPTYVNKLIMVGSGLFDPSYAKNIMETILNRLSKEKQSQLHNLMKQIDENCSDSDFLFHQFGKLTEEGESYDLIKVSDSEATKGQSNIYNNVWPEAEKIRASGELLAAGKKIKCPVIAIHGDFDPHPYQGVQEPLSRVLVNFTFILLDKCGHEPWNERQASDRFYNLIKDNLHEIKNIMINKI
jgi:pimeloyl-ACP methyl ester carboxylesterase